MIHSTDINHKWALFLALSISLLFLFGCGGEDQPVATEASSEVEEPEVEETPTAPPERATQIEEDEPEVTPTSSLTPTATPVPSETPTPLPAGINLEPYYVLDDDGQLTVAEITSPTDGWVAVYPSTQGEINADLALGYGPISAGRQNNILIQIDIERVVGRTIQVALHDGAAGADFDPSNESLLYITTTEVDTPLTQPEIVYQPQKVDPEIGSISIDRVQTFSPGWVQVVSPSSGNVLGYAPVEPGENVDVAVPFRYLESEPKIELHLLEDRGEPGIYEPDLDKPVLIDDEPVIVSSDILLPFEIVLYDQPANDIVFVNRVISDEPGFLVVYNDVDDDDQIDIAIGFVYIEAGLTENLSIDINEGAATDQIHLTHHEDVNGDQQFDFPGEDQIRVIDEQIRLFSARTDLGGFIVVSDQPVVDGTVTVDLISAVGSSWIALFAADPEIPHRAGGEVLGEATIANGITANVEIPIEGVTPGETVFARIHTDNGDPELFEPSRTDWPQQHEGRDIIISFKILE